MVAILFLGMDPAAVVAVNPNGDDALSHGDDEECA